MAVLVTTPDFLRWCGEHGYTKAELDSPPVAWALVELYKRERALQQEEE